MRTPPLHYGHCLTNTMLSQLSYDAERCRSAARAETRRLVSPDSLRGPRPLQRLDTHHVGGAHDDMHTRVLLEEGTQYLIVPPDESHRLHRPRVESPHELR